MTGRRLGALLLALGLAACATPQAQTPWRITTDDAGRRIQVPVGTMLDVALPGNPTTGYIWQRAAGDEGGVEQLGAPQFESEGPLAGQGGTVHVFFRVTKPEVTRLELVYRRPFEKKTPPAETFSVTIVGED